MITTGWADHEQTILVWKMQGDWHVDDYERAVIDTMHLTKSKNRDFTVIVDMRYGKAPDDVFTIAQHGLKYWRSSSVQVIVVGLITKWQSLYSMAKYLTSDIQRVLSSKV